MKAPEKIYLQPSVIEQLPHQNIVYTKPLADNSIEYTRTDAFIEKACEFLNDRIKHDSIDYPMATVHLIDDFKNYLKGE